MSVQIEHNIFIVGYSRAMDMLGIFILYFFGIFWNFFVVLQEFFQFFAILFFLTLRGEIAKYSLI